MILKAPYLFALAILVLAAPAANAQNCVKCHKGVTPGIVKDWQLSAHSTNDVGCEACHGEHKSSKDVDRLQTVTADICATCHDDQFQQFKRGKHSLAWAAVKAMPTAHWQPMAMIDGMKGCGGCHKIGLKDKAEIEALKAAGSSFGYASCDACHTRHTFSVKEAREPESCATCHMGFDHPQWEMWSTSKHGVRHRLKRDGVLPEDAAAPVCQTCHMPKGDHEVRTAWGFLAVRTDGLGPYPGEDPSWWKDRVTILQALGVLDAAGKPTERLDVVAAAQVARLSASEFDAERNKMLKICGQCHSENFAREELGKGDQMIQEADILLADAIRTITALYVDGVLKRPDKDTPAIPDLLKFHDSATVIENRLFKMHLKHRMRTFQGVFHANPDYALWYGWSEMRQDLTEIHEMARELRRRHAGK